MKSRKIQSQDGLILTASETVTNREQKYFRPKKRVADSSYLKRSADILQTYKGILNRPIGYNGNPDTLFKQSLRNYDDFDISKTFKWAQKFLSADKSFESLKSLRRSSAPKFGEGDRPGSKYAKQKAKPQELRHLQRKSSHSLKSERPKTFKVARPRHTELEEKEDAELEEFYSPTSQPEELTRKEVKSVPDSQTRNSENLTDRSDKDYVMADDELSNVENLMQRAESELDEMMAETEGFTSEEAGGEQELPEISEEGDVPEASEELTSESATPGDQGELTGISEQDEPSEMVDEVTTSGAEATESGVTNNAGEAVVESSDIGETTESTTEVAERSEGGDGRSPAFDSNIDSALLKELEEAEKQAMDTAKIIYELKERVAELLSTPTMTQAEAKELEQKNKLLSHQMSIFEAKTKRIQFLIQQANIFDSSGEAYKEDVLPKVIICGMTENNMPKIIVCDDQKKSPPSPKSSFNLPPPVSVMPQFAKRLSESYYMQERLAAENADLEGKRYQLQEDLIDKDQTVESLQRKLQSIQGELRLVCKENSLLNEKLQRVESCPAGSSNLESDEYGDIVEAQPCKKHSKKKRMPCGKGKGPCPADVEARLQGYSDTTQQLEKQLCDMEDQVRNMQSELVSVQKERQHLEQHRRMLSQPPCPPPCPPPPCPGAPCAPAPCAPAPCAPPPCAKPPCPGPCNPNARMGSDQQLRELREQYNRLQDDYKAKLTEVAGLRADSEKFKQNVKDAEEAKKAAEEKVRECERDLKNYRSDKDKLVGSKEQLIEQEQQLNVAKQRFREAQDELEELRALIQDQQAQLDDYRNKYLQAQQQVEEQRRQIDMMELENNRISEQVNLEIQRVKNQFQEKLQELTPLPDILKATQLKLQETQQMHLLAERNNEAIMRELQAYRDKAAAMADQMERVRSDQQVGADEKASVEQRAQDLERKCNELQDDNDRLKTDLAKTEEVAEQNEKRVQEKLHEIAQLVSQLETVREESARQVARTKDRCETVRRSMQNQIADLERQLAQSRAQARSAQKDRDDIRQKMQSQINNLNENFEDAKMRIRNLQGHVNFLKNSYTNVFPGDNMVSDALDACDCGNPY